MAGWDVHAAWLALRGRDPRLASPRINRSAPRKRSLKPLLLSALVIAFVGAAILVVGIAGEAVHDQWVDPRHPHPLTLVEELTTFRVWLKLGIELGYACLIAAVVSFFIEATARREQTELFEEAMSDIGESVLKGVYQIDHDPDYVDAVINTCLAVRLVRKDTEITYTISEFSEAECLDMGISRETFVRVDAEVAYLAKNIGARDENFEAAYNIPVRHGRVADFARVTAIEAGTARFDADQVDALMLKPGHPDHGDGSRSYRFPLPIAAGDHSRVAISSRFAKERSDNEMFTFLLPTLGAKIRFLFTVDGLEIGASANMAADMPDKKEIVAGRHVKWEILGPLVPSNNVTIWWRTPKDSGAVPTDPPLPATRGSTPFPNGTAAAATPETVLHSPDKSITRRERIATAFAVRWKKIVGS